MAVKGTHHAMLMAPESLRIALGVPLHRAQISFAATVSSRAAFARLLVAEGIEYDVKMTERFLAVYGSVGMLLDDLEPGVLYVETPAREWVRVDLFKKES